jgi:pSer/pThr/pTyr-binding forkhead associated (FHA) protein
MRLLIEHPSRPPRGIVVETPFALVGSAEAGAIVLPGEQISRKHVCLQTIGGRLWAFDLVSRTGTFWGSRRKNHGWFESRQSIRVGPYELRVFPEDRASVGSNASPFRPLPPDQDSLPSATLEFLNAHRAGSVQIPTFHLDRPLTLVGQSPRCKIRFSCPTVSTCHCSLLRTPRGIWIVDLHSREGVTVNGVKVRWARLRDGDCLGIGRFEVLVHLVPRRLRTAPSMPPMSMPPMSTCAARTFPAEPATSATEPAPRANDHPGPARHEVAVAPTTSALAQLPPFAGALATLGTENGALAPANLGAVALPASAGTDAAQTLLLTFVNHFAMMQQQMFDQFQQQSMMVMQMFGTMQRDQMELVRQELESLRELNREIVSVQAELAKHQAEERAGPRPPAAAPEPRSVPEPKHAALWSPTPAFAPTDPAPARRASQVDLKATTGNAAASSEEDVHAWLSQRFNHLQQESKTRWQKLLATVVG